MVIWWVTSRKNDVSALGTTEGIKGVFMIIGIIGAENSHAAVIAENLNIRKKIKGARVVYIWGETKEVAEKTAIKGNIPHIVSKSSEIVDKIDAVIIDHRNGKYHLNAGLPFIRKGLPVFIDKPFCCNVEQGRKFLSKAQKWKAVVTSFGVLPLQKSFSNLLKETKKVGKIHSGSIYGPCDIKSKYGGIFFYGIHQVEMALSAFGYDVYKVFATQNKKNATAQMFYNDGKTITLNLIESGCNSFSITAVGNKGIVHKNISFDKEMYLSGIRKFTRMFETKVEPLTHKQLLKPVEILEAIQKSIQTGQYQKI